MDDLNFCSTLKAELDLIERTEISNKDEFRWGPHVSRFLIRASPRGPDKPAKEDEPLIRHVWSAPTTFSGAQGCAALAWRVQVQGITLIVYSFLCEFNFVDYSGMEGVVNLETPEWLVWNVQEALANFAFFKRLYKTPEIAISKRYTAPLTWLSCMTVRGTRVDRLEPILEFLDALGIIGKLEQSDLHWPAGFRFYRKPDALDPDPNKAPPPVPMDFRLPMGVLLSVEGHISQIERFSTRFHCSFHNFMECFRYEREGTAFPAIDLR